jgi:hypothetical protein
MSANINIQLKIEKLSQFVQEGPDSRRLSDAVYLHGLPWKILAFPREVNPRNNELPICQRKCLSYYLQCNANYAGNINLHLLKWTTVFSFLDPAWRCNGSATFKVLAQKAGTEDHVRKITHVFNAKQNDWGWAQFMKFHV